MILMVGSVVHEIDRLQAQVSALERENEHLKAVLAEQADRLAKRQPAAIAVPWWLRPRTRSHVF
jgi:cell division septum initiation protein DivIVA